MKKFLALAIFVVAFFAACSAEMNAGHALAAGVSQEPTEISTESFADISVGAQIPVTEPITTEPSEPSEQMAPAETEAPAAIEPSETEPPIADENITFSYEYVSGGDVMPYGLFTPSAAAENEKTPLIVWLHGSGEKNIYEVDFGNRGLPYVLNNWNLDGFNAYVICPQLTGNWNTGKWDTLKSKDNLQALLDKFISEHNVDAEKVVIAGHSLGGQGALFMAHELPDYFSKMAVLSGYAPCIDISGIEIPSIGYVGMAGCGEDETTINYMVGHFKPTFGEENMFRLPSSHSNLPYEAFNEDKNEDGRSDIIEWMLYE